METRPSPSSSGVGRNARGLHLDAVHLGECPQRDRDTLGIRATRSASVCQLHGRRLAGSKNNADDYTFIAIELAGSDEAPVRCLR